MENNRTALVAALSDLQTPELVDVVRRVFQERIPFQGDEDICRSRYFLGVASSDLLAEEGEPERWEPWKVAAVAYPDSAHYGEQLGPDWGLPEEGHCTVCGAEARSNVKHGICAVCGNEVYMT